MADSEQILQLGIEEARSGNREEARNLFELLTRQEPNNSTAWLWLAGVADNTDQRRAALQRVLELDPNNDMARRGLESLGVASTSAPVVSSPAVDVDTSMDRTVAPVAHVEEVAPPPEPVRPVEITRDRSADEQFADELDSAFDDYDALPRAETQPRRVIEPTPIGSREDDRPTATGRRSVSRLEIEDDDYEPVRSGPSPILWAALILGLVLVLGWLLMQFLGNRNPVATRPTNVVATRVVATVGATSGEATAIPGAVAPGATAAPGATTPGEATAIPGAAAPGEATAAPGATAPGEATAVPGTAAPATPGEATAVPGGAGAVPAGPVTPAEQANPASVDIGTRLEANGWAYSFPNTNYAVYIGNQAAGQTAQGEFLHVLMVVANNSGTPQNIPADFFVLKDAQGRVHNALPELSNALVQRGVNADVGMQDAVPANGSDTSMYLVFDVPKDATDLTLFARGNPAQGWKLTPLR